MVREERGSALLLVLFMIVVFVLLGIAVTGAAVGGAKLTQKRENDVQSLHRAEKALNVAVAHIGSKYDTRSGSEVTLEQLEKDLKDLQALSSEEGEEADEAEGDHQVIESIRLLTCTEDSKCIEIKAKANVNGVERTLVQEVMLTDYPEALNYVMGSQGNVTLNGTPYMLGNIYVGGELKAKDQAEYKYEEVNHTEKTFAFPKVTQKVYIPGEERISYCDSETCTGTNYKPIGGDNKSLSEVLGTDKLEARNNNQFVSINFDNSFIDKAAEAVRGDKEVRKKLADAYAKPGDDSEGTALVQVMKPYMTADQIIVPPVLSEEPTKEKKEEYDAYLAKMNGDFTESVVHDGDLFLDGNEIKRLNYIKKEDPTLPGKKGSKWFVVHGDLTIQNESSDINYELPIKANILVTGNITIRGKVKVDSTIFTLGDGGTEISDASIKGMEGADGISRKELLLFSKGPILITRVNSFEPITRDYEPNPVKVEGSNVYQLDAFFYTEQNATLYGVGSIFWIHGGFFAKGDLTLNAVRGNTSENAAESKLNVEAQPGLPLQQSRLILDYKQNLISNQEVGLPRVERFELKVGNRRLE
ncbi:MULTISPECIES: hypothetical protein [Paenibacillus]|uniref:hypothetical protein n=1 Tax=Paenibacillus TaxID=44249 RepID=UPI0022B8E070|nr:hypothetical protein [Paenibacillus caseinilyticus]MCZ8519770.1 hypothetical protein [Paenibacillus caseinilyticus]